MELEERTSHKLEELAREFSDTFNNRGNFVVKTSPASLMIMGDHTHYNDGILLSVPVSEYATVILRKRKDCSKNVLFENKLYRFHTDAEEDFANNWLGEYLQKLFIYLDEKWEECFGFDALLEAEIPECLGIGRYSAIGSAFVKALYEDYNIYQSDIEIADVTQGVEKQIIEQISNRGHHFTSILNPKNAIILTDLREEEPQLLEFPAEDYRIILADTGIRIKNPSAICNERIEECMVGVSGLRLYIWGIKNLRDVELDFLKSHVHMIPKIVYRRCYYNVTEKSRVEKAISLINVGALESFGQLIRESHNGLKSDYDLSSEQQNFIVTAAKEHPGYLGGKMISCSPKRAVYNLVRKEFAEDFIRHIRDNYRAKFGKDLEIRKLKFAEGE